MKIAVIGANGKSGRLIVKEALAKGIEVTAVVRSKNTSDAPEAIAKDIFDLRAEDLAGFDAVVDAFGVWDPAQLSQHSSHLVHVCSLLSGRETRLVVVGGAGSLFMDAEHKTRLMDTAGFPDAYKPVADAMVRGLEELRARNDVRWTYISPAADFRADGEKTGCWQFGGEEFITNKAGDSVISYADYAAALIEEVVKGAHICERISVIGC